MDKIVLSDGASFRRSFVPMFRFENLGLVDHRTMVAQYFLVDGEAHHVSASHRRRDGQLAVDLLSRRKVQDGS